MKSKNISIFGLGYVGCVSLGCLAKNGHQVIGVDVVQHKIDLINNGKPTIIEKDIDTIIANAHKEGRISATTDNIKAVKETEVSIICVGTPSTGNGHLNLEYIYNTARGIGEALRDKNSFHVVAIRSTVLLGTNKKVGEIIEEISGKKRNEDFAVVSNPEFLREGSAVKDYYNPPVTVIGSENERALDIMSEIYSEINAPIERTEVKEAEIIKYVNNSFHALKITFANEVGNICKKLGIDSHKVMDLFCKDTHLNISPYYFKPGFAYGGSCLPKDLKALNTIAHDAYLNSPVLESIERSNQNQKRTAFELIVSKGKRKIGILGLSFKKGTDDLRYSPIVEVTESLLGKGYEISIFDEKVNLSNITGTNKHYIDTRIPHLSKLLKSDLEEVVEASDLLVISQNDERFRDLIDRYPDKLFVDLVRVVDENRNHNYEGIGW
ncbi:UDP-glucose dehydrogenase family protein [Nafulsella turpanensis]|uniref:UDP-glucose dehydrogenase family protein n=1 Tax=Nafulsella turpanensis TaxID=1265690 RepID=UPI00034AD050|nr:UDP-glucose/GDP-mannose dehydrogenase family protein [Nafulsella turpanensis]